jgi:hypothetical protein
MPDRIETKIIGSKTLHVGGVPGHSNKKPGYKAGLFQQSSFAGELLR